MLAVMATVLHFQGSFVAVLTHAIIVDQHCYAVCARCLHRRLRTHCVVYIVRIHCVVQCLVFVVLWLEMDQ